MCIAVLTYFNWTSLDTFWLGTISIHDFSLEIMADAGMAGSDRFRQVGQYLRYTYTLKDSSDTLVDIQSYINLDNEFYKNSSQLSTIQLTSLLQDLSEALLVECAPVVPNLSPSPTLEKLVLSNEPLCDDEVDVLLQDLTPHDLEILRAVGVKPNAFDFWVDSSLARINRYLSKHLPF